MCFIIKLPDGTILDAPDLPSAIQTARNHVTDGHPVGIYQKVRVVKVEPRIVVEEVGVTAPAAPHVTETHGDLHMGRKLAGGAQS